MVGIDITKISRFENKDSKFIERILHKDEITLYNEASNKARFLATRWAIKEALFKADNSNLPFNNIRIDNINGVYIYEGYNISTSTEDDFYIAIVMKGNNET